jgi:hypothetical protein
MNERIRQLAEQAFFDDATGQPSDRMYTFSDHKMQKFAELIVRDCALTLYKSAVQDEQAGFAHEAKIMELAGDMIKQHFGVES